MRRNSLNMLTFDTDSGHFFLLINLAELLLLLLLVQPVVLLAWMDLLFSEGK